MFSIILRNNAGVLKTMEILTSRKNPHIRHFRELGTERSARKKQGEFLCDGRKMLHEALQFGAEVTGILWNGEPDPDIDPAIPAWSADEEMLRYVSPLENSPGPVFSVKILDAKPEDNYQRVLVLENVQDPGNVGTVLRSAAAFGMDLVILTGECADPYNPKTVRATMGAIFRQRFLEMPLSELKACCESRGLPLYGAALREDAKDIRTLPLSRCAVAVGNEGRGLSDTLLSLCDETLIIPMSPNSESLNAAVAASVIMWEMSR